MNPGTRLMLVTNTYAPYRVPVWRALAAKVDRLEVVLLTEQEANRNWDLTADRAYSIRALDTRGGFLSSIDGGLYWGGGIRRLLAEWAPTQLIIGGYSAPPFLEAIFWARRQRVPVTQWYESHALSSRFQRGPIRWLRQALLRRADSWAVPGTRSRDYLVSMGIPGARIVVAPNSVDLAAFASDAGDPQGRHGPPRFLYVGQYIERKCVDQLIEAFGRVGGQARLRLVGYGPLEASLREQAAALAGVEFHPATTRLEQTAAHYAWADVLVMPSNREVWGLVVNEALAAGCYVLSSRVAAVTADLVDAAPLEVGRSVDPSAGAGALAAAMDRVIQRIAEVRARRSEIRRWGKGFTPERTAAGLNDALRVAARRDRT